MFVYVPAKNESISMKSKCGIHYVRHVNKIQYGRRIHGNKTFFSNLIADFKTPYYACYMCEIW